MVVSTRFPDAFVGFRNSNVGCRLSFSFVGCQSSILGCTFLPVVGSGQSDVGSDFRLSVASAG